MIMCVCFDVSSACKGSTDLSFEFFLHSVLLETQLYKHL